MRTLKLCLAVVVFVGVDVGLAAAQEVGQSLTLTGCLAQEDEDGQAEYLLSHVEGEAANAEEIELSASAGVDLAPHAGHTVEVTGTVMADDEDDADDDGADDDGADDDDGDDDELDLEVVELSHVDASCTQD